jgi:hypothetical protein
MDAKENFVFNIFFYLERFYGNKDHFYLLPLRKKCNKRQHSGRDRYLLKMHRKKIEGVFSCIT